MTPERWQQIESVLRQAEGLDESGRRALLDTFAPSDPDLVQEVETLLEADGEVGQFLEDLAAQGAHQLLESLESLDLPPETPESEDPIAPEIGAYRILRSLGRGGMGTVYLAERADRSFKKAVAIKVLKRGLDTDEILRRFLQERRILAQLEHPHIARLLDAATTTDGRPCFVMEYVDGTPIDDFCHRNGLDLQRRIELFEAACSAVQAAHQNLVIHRDLKPSNILVTADGTPKLLDFGIAKLLDPSQDSLVAPTIAWHPMTPQYASPEQIRGEPISTASDVYSLGVLLHRLLTGRPPYALPKSSGIREAERVVCEAAVPPPSQIVRALDDPTAGTLGPVHKLARRLEGDLDTIVLKALAKEPDRRYGSVQQLTADLRRYLEGRPILARPPTWRYRAGKFLQRHRGMTAMAVLALLLLLTGITTTSWQAHVARLERMRAEAEGTRAQAVSSFLEELFQISDPLRTPDEISARDLLDLGARRLANQPWTQPEVQARLLDTIGRSYQGLGLYEDSARYLEQALHLRRRHLGSEHLEVADTLNHLASVRMDQGDYRSAEKGFREVLATRRGALGDGHLEVAEAMNNLAEALRRLGESQASEDLLHQALEIKKASLGQDHPSIAVGLNNLAGILARRGDFEGAAGHFREALQIRRRVLGERSPAVAESLNNLGSVLYQQGNLTDASEAFDEAFALRRELLGEDHPATLRSLGNLATTLLHLGEAKAAEPLLRQVLEQKIQQLGAEHPSVGITQRNLAQALEAQGQEPEAEIYFREALALHRSALEAHHPEIASGALALGQFLLDQGRSAEAASLLEEAASLRRSLPVDDWRRALAESALGALYLRSGPSEEGETLFHQSLTILERTLGPKDPRTQRARARWEG